MVDCSIQVHDLWYRYDEQPPALRGITLEIAGGAWVAILGCNGSGKSTLIKHFNGLLRPWRGRVCLAGQDTAGRPVGQLAQRVGYLPQNPDRLIFSASMRDEVAFGPRQRGLSGAALEARVGESLALLGLSEVAELPPAVLGYGLRRKVALAAVLALHPEALVLDEPTNGLDAGSARAFMRVVRDFHQRGATIVMVTHDLELAARHAQRVLLLQEGQLVAQGETRGILSDIPLLRKAGLPALPITQLGALFAGARPAWPRDLLTPQEFAAAYGAAGRREGAA